MATRLNVRWLRGFVGVVVGVGTILTLAHGARGQVAYELLHAFTRGGSNPASPLIQASDGNFYGTTELGGGGGGGTVFKMDGAGTVTTLHSFDCNIGCHPRAGLIQATDGNFYGMTVDSGSTFFMITAAGTFTTLHSFDCSTEGCVPYAGLIQASDGNFYGTTTQGGTFGAGTVFKITTAGTLTTLHSFDCSTEGCFPAASLIQASDGNFYGTTASDAAGGGTVFRMDEAGTVTTLHSFDCSITDGCQPYAALIQASDGNLYGTTTGGGPAGFGTVFKITAAGTFTALHGFDCSTDGCQPGSAGLIEASDGTFYGTTGGSDGGGGGIVFGGTVFKITAAGTFTTLHFFDCSTEGCGPSGGLIQASDGNFYGTTITGGLISVGGSSGDGTVFKMDGAGTVDTLHSFNSGGCGTEGCVPVGLIQATDGNFYGTTNEGGAFGVGTVFKVTAAGDLTTLHSFDCSTGGCTPWAGLIQASDGNFYGTTAGGGAGGGTIFKMDEAGTVTTLHSFDCGITDGCQPDAGLIQASDGNLYGTTTSGGAAASGTVFKITAAGDFTTLHSFNCSTEGCFPVGGLIQASDGNFYGTASQGGAFGVGTVFKVTAAGDFTTLHSFDCSTEGCLPYAGLIQASDGNFYGTTAEGGAGNGGTVFKMDEDGTVTTLHSFDCGITDGCQPSAALIQATDGNFYGTTKRGGAFGLGTVFKVTAAGDLTTLHSFDCSTDGCLPLGGLIQASDGNFYGTALLGPGGGGVLFRLAGRLSALSPSRVWIGLKNSDDVGLRLDLLAEVFVDSTKVGEGQLTNVSAGSSGFKNAVLNAIPLDLTGGAVAFPFGSALKVKVSVRRTCSGGGHASGIVRLWYNSQPIDSGGKRDAGSRFDVISSGVTTDYFLRGGFALSTAPGSSRQSIDVSVDTKQTCPSRTFKSFGTWSITP